MAGMVNPSIIREGLIARGIPPHIADGFVMNMRDESGLNPGVNEAAPIVPGSRGGYGLYQVTGPRRTAYEQFAEGRGLPLNSVDAQLDFLMTELQGPESRAARSIMAAPDANSAAVTIAKDFLRPSPEHLQRRVDRYSGGDSVANDTMAALGRSPIGGNQMVTSAQGGPEQEQGRGGLLGFFSDPDKRAKLAIALEGMTLNPNTAYMQMLGADIKGRADERKTVEGKKQQAATMNKTVEWLRNNGAADLADALMTGAIDPGAAVSAQMGRMKPNGPIEGKAVGDALVNPVTGEVIYQGQAKDQGAASAIGKLQGDLSAGRISQEQYEIALANMAPAGMSFESDSQGNVRLVQGANAGTQKPLTEGQSKDTVYVTRAEGALSVLDPIADNLTSRTGRAAEYDPTGFAREKLQTPDFQVAKTAGDEFLQAILRKDTGAAITAGEQALYGTTYLPQPGDGPQQLEYKKAARRRAVEAIKAGLPPSAIIAQEKALTASGSQSLPPVAPPSGGEISDDDLLKQYGG